MAKIVSRRHARVMCSAYQNDGVPIAFNGRFVHDAIDFIGGNSRSQSFPRHVQYLATYATGMTQSRLAVQFLRRIHSNVVVPLFVALFDIRNPRIMIGVVRLSNVRWNGASGSVQSRTEQSCETILPGPSGEGQFQLRRSIDRTRHAIGGRRFAVRSAGGRLGRHEIVRQ